VSVVIELAGLELAGHHGAFDEEREALQPFLYDVGLEVDEPHSDGLEQTVDYRELVALIREVSGGREFQLLETLAATIADAMLARFPARSVTVRVRKPHVQLGLPVDYAAASVRRERS
jgi:dihydroneopterin aldolase